MSRSFFPQTGLVDSQREFINELSGLRRDRYITMYEVYTSFLWMAKLQHQTNGRKLTLVCYPDQMYLREGGKLLKAFPAEAKPF